MNILSIVNQKGGVAKTTTAVTLAHGLALRGYRILLVDLDAQGNCADALGIQKSGALYRFLVLDEGIDAVAVQVRDNLDLIAGDKTTVKAKKIISGESFSEHVLRTALEGITRNYDLVVLDSAPGADVLQINALVACTHFLIPVSLSHLATVGVVDALGTVSSLKQVGAFQGRFLGVLPTLWERTTKESQAQLLDMAKHFKRLVWPPVPEDVKAREAPRAGKTLWEYAPDTRALVGVQESGKLVGGYRAILERLAEEVLNG